MRLDLTFTEHFKAPVQNVWRAITDRRMLALWLMANDFEPRLGARFALRRADPMPGWRGWVECEVIELEPPTRMVWSWSDGAGEEMTSHVIFELREEGTGTRLTLRHIGGDTDDAIAKMIRERWPIKLQALASTLGDERCPRRP
jgi:uncharacterized protein YndB with AHSA1/START domain